MDIHMNHIHSNGGLRTRRTIVCSSNPNSAHHLRAHLDRLHSEAHITTTKGNNARTRLMRLSEAAEKLQRQALTCVEAGKDDDARDLLFQKKKIMQTLDKTKNRIQLLDQLSSQLNKAITIKENQLIETVAQDHNNVYKEDDTSDPVRIVPPREEQATEHGDQSAEASEEIETEATDDAIKRISYENFLQHVDKQLREIEEQLATVINLSSLVLEEEAKGNNSKVQHTIEIYEGVCRIRARIASMVQVK